MLPESDSLSLFSEEIAKGHSLLVEGLWESPKAALLSLAWNQEKRSILIVTGCVKQSRFLENLPFFHLAPLYELPSWEMLPAEDIPPSPDIAGRRMEILYKLATDTNPSIVVTSWQALAQRIPSPAELKKKCLFLKKGEEIDLYQLAKTLDSLGYQKMPLTSDKGHYSVRGGILDLYPLSAPHPYRLEFFGDTIEEMRFFDPVSQKSMGQTEKIFLCPASEKDLAETSKDLMLLFDYFKTAPLLVFDELLLLEDKAVSLTSLAKRSPLFTPTEEILEKSSAFQTLFFSGHPLEELGPVEIEKRAGRAYYAGSKKTQKLTFSWIDREWRAERYYAPFQTVSEFLSHKDTALSQGEALLKLSEAKTSIDLHLIADTESEETSWKKAIAELGLPFPSYEVERGYLSSGFALLGTRTLYLPQTEFIHRSKVIRSNLRNTYHTPAAEFHDLAVGEFIVHYNQGIGQFLGVEKQKNHLGEETEFFVIGYAENSKLFVPAPQAHLISRYIGIREAAPALSTLGSNRWTKTREQAESSIVGFAKQLLERTAERTYHGGFAFFPDGDTMHLFEESFPYQETEDQSKAILEVKKDMISSKAMDRLICGDVGYGKTEVAMRAAFKAVVDGGKQVALLVPTTVLAMQHFEVFRERMEGFPVRIALLSRFQKKKEVHATLENVELHEVDILIGTHRIISQDVRFANLGLVIIDEEQRFGVRAKEHLKKFQAGVDCLTLSATPIPRTLYLSLIGAKQISPINTPPQDRLPIKTILVPKDPTLIQNAILRELSRDGQVFYIHNRVETLPGVQLELQALLPQARIAIAHGQMDADEIDETFQAFKAGTIDILLSTTIVENGVDIPNANTILIERADQFGLADLYQMRGRVGRSTRPAYAYFLIPPGRVLSEVSRKRLQALAEASGFGGGMKIALRDLEIRGAGDLLGVQQSGQVCAIGFHLYCKLLRKAVDKLKRNEPLDLFETKIESSFDAKLPESYIGEMRLRMEIYHRLGEASSLEEVDELLKELQDRFGKPPSQVLWLYHLTRLRIFASSLRFTLLKFEKHTFTAERGDKKSILRKTLKTPKYSSPADFEEKLTTLLRTEFYASSK